MPRYGGFFFARKVRMHIRHLTPELLHGLNSAMVPSPQEQDHLEVRLLAMYVTVEFLNSLVGPLTLISQLTPSLIYQVAVRSGNPNLIAGMFAAGLILATPHAIALICFPRSLALRWPRKLATLAASLVALTWAYLAVLTFPIDVGSLFWLYAREVASSMGLAFLYAISLNAQLLRAIHKVLNP